MHKAKRYYCRPSYWVAVHTSIPVDLFQLRNSWIFMYIYDEHDQRLINERVQQYRHQTERYLAGELSEDEFLPLRLQNGLYIQRLAPMMRIAVPYGLLSSKQLRKLADISRKFDIGYVHFTTRQISSSIGHNSQKHLTYSKSWQRLKCTPFRPVATAYAMSLQISLPV